jgi:diguanylate cyclase (GGDEF)-like protein
MGSACPPGPEHERRRGQMARFGAMLFGAAAVVTLLGLVLPHQREVDVLGLEVLTAVAAVVALGLLVWGERLPVTAYMAVAALGTGLVSLGIVSNGERHGGAAGGDEMYYLWVVLYCAYFFGRLATAAQVALVSLSYAVVLAIVQPGDVATSRWISTVGLVVGAAVVVRLLSERIAALLTSLGAAANTDSLTGLANRLAFEDAFRRESARASRDGSHFALLLADLDQLKGINDQFGHQAGDEAICEVASVLRETLRGADFAARVGGDEFAVLLPETGAEGARVLGERLSHALCERAPTARCLGLSFGVAVPAQPGAPLDDVMRAADEALYRSKKANASRSARRRLTPSQA